MSSKIFIDFRWLKPGFAIPPSEMNHVVFVIRVNQLLKKDCRLD